MVVAGSPTPSHVGNSPYTITITGGSNDGSPITMVAALSSTNGGGYSLVAYEQNYSGSTTFSYPFNVVNQAAVCTVNWGGGTATFNSSRLLYANYGPYYTP